MATYVLASVDDNHQLAMRTRRRGVPHGLAVPSNDHHLSTCQREFGMADGRILAPLSCCCRPDEHIWWAYDSDHAEYHDVSTHSGSDRNGWYVKLPGVALEFMLTRR
jgi:hypothetical protein